MSAMAVDRAWEEQPVWWWLFLVTGIAWLVFAFIVFSFTYTTVWAVALFAGFGLLFAGISELMVSWALPEWRWLHILMAVIFFIAGVIALVWPGQTFLVMARLVGLVLLLWGAFDFIEALMTRHLNELWWLQLITGIAMILLAFWAARYPGRSIVLLVIWVGAISIGKGITDLITAFRLRKLRA
jgi:uncharacterized membrane protein HdeD (DUF308 family)